VVVYAPLTPTPFPEALPTPTPLPAPVAPTTWDGGIGTIFRNSCGSCHGEILQMGNLDVLNYSSTLAGGSLGPGVIPGDPGASQVIIIQEAGGHASQFTANEMELIRDWIEAGAPEN
jgi:hypothetical protein